LNSLKKSLWFKTLTQQYCKGYTIYLVERYGQMHCLFASSKAADNLIFLGQYDDDEPKTYSEQ
jgi:adenine deaminase